MQPTTPSGSLTTIASWRRLDRRDHPAGVVAADLGVVVEGRRRPLQLVAVLEQRLAALGGHRPRQLLGVLAQPPRHLVQQLAALAGGRARPARPGLPGGGHGRLDLLGRGRLSPSTIVSVVYGFSTATCSPRAGDELAADQQPGFVLVTP